MGKKNHDRETFNAVMRGLRQRTPSAAEIAKDKAREEQIQKEAKRIRDESERIKRELEKQARAEAAHQRAEEDRRKKK